MPDYTGERELEIGETLKFIKEHPDIKVTLDVGAHNTYTNYAQKVKDLVDHCYGVDIIEDDETAKILDLYTVGNVKDLIPADRFDLVFSISSIEHAGISTYKADWEKERVDVFKAMYDLAFRYLVITCPFGAPMIIDGQYANITPKHLEQFKALISPKHKVETDFWFTEGQSSPFRRINYEEACKVEFDPAIGVPRCIMVMKVVK